MKCPVCESKFLEYVEKRYSEKMNMEYKIFKCKNCFLQFSIPLEPASPSHYEEYEWYWERWEFKEALKFLKGKGNKILEIGCGEGYFLNLAKKKGFEVVGIDFNEKAVKIAKEKFKLKNVYAMEIDEFLKICEDKFDAVCFFHFIEHLKNPFEFLLKLKRVIKKNGFIVFSLPNERRPRVKFGLREDWDYPPHHLTRWSDKSIKLLVKKASFKIIYIKEEPLKYDYVLNILMIKIHFGLTKKFIKIENSIYENISNINKKFSNRLKRTKQLIFIPFAILLTLLLKLLNQKGVAKLIIATNGSDK